MVAGHSAGVSSVLRRANRHGTLKTYGALYLRYGPGCSRWELLTLLHKLAFVLTRRLLGRYPTAQLVLLFAVVVGSLVLQRCYQQFLNNHLAKLEECALCTILTVVAVARLSHSHAVAGVICTALVVLVLGAGGAANAGTVFRMVVRQHWIGRGEW